MAVVLDTRGYRVWATCQTLPDNLPAVPDLCVIVHTLIDAGKKANAFGKMACREFPEVPVIAVILGKSNMAKPNYSATRILHEPGMCEILEAIRILMVRKRGPKRKVVAA